MRIKKYRSLGLEVPVSVFESPAEYNAAAKRPNEDAVVEDANDNLVYRGALADFREEFCVAVEGATGIKRTSVAVLGKDGKPKVDSDGAEIVEWDENEADYFRRVIASSGRSVESFQEIADATAAKLALAADPTVRERKPAGPKTPAKSTYAIADQLIADGKATHTAADLSKLLGRHVEHDREGLARGIHEYQLAEIRKIKSTFAVKSA